MTLLELFALWAAVDAEGLAASGWAFHPLHVDAELAAIGAMRGTEIHFVVRPEWRGRLITRRRTRAFLAPLFERWGFLTTRAESGAHAQIRFITRLGFVQTYAGPLVNHYMLSVLPYSKQEK